MKGRRTIIAPKGMMVSAKHSIEAQVAKRGFKKPSYTLVDDCLDWRQMRGRNDFEKKLNSYLTYAMIWRHDIPDDECLELARAIARFRNFETSREKIAHLIDSSFSGGMINKWGGNGSWLQATNAPRRNSHSPIVEGIIAIGLFERKPPAWKLISVYPESKRKKRRRK